jgi:hypothetical protein
MNRRKFLGMAAAGAAGLALPAARAGQSADTALAHPRLLEILRDERAVRKLGQRYRETVPAENAAPALTRAIRDERAQVDDLVQRDFAAGRTVTLNGWILSVTEARQCALFSLLPA